METIATIQISPTGIVLNDRRLEVVGSGIQMLNDIYRRYINDYPKYFKMDGLCKLGFVASELLLANVDEERFVPREDRAVMLCNRSGSHEADVHFQATIGDKDNYFPSPSVFVYTLPNIVTGEIAIRNQYYGETSFYVLDHHDDLSLRHLLDATLADEATKSVLAGWVDYEDDTHFEANMQLINKK